MRASADYREFIRRSAVELQSVPETALSLFAGSGFLRLGPHWFERVRQGQSRFGLPPDQIFDDLEAGWAAQRRAFVGRVYRRLRRAIRYVLCLLKLGFVVYIVFRCSARKMRGRPVSGLPVSAPCPRPAAVPRASIVMLSYNRLPYLQTALASFLETVGNTPHELIVVDNGSGDGSVEFLQDAQRAGHIARLVLLNENVGISAGYNHGFAMAHPACEFLMKLDSDIKLLSSDWLARATDFLSSHPQVGFIALNQTNHAMLRLLPRLRVDGQRVMDFGGWTVGGAMLIPRRTWDDVGCFVEDAQLKYNPDDIDYYARVSRRGYQAYFLHDLRVYHQTELDAGVYREYSLAKPASQSSRLALELARQYDRGDRPLTVRYEKCQSSSAPGSMSNNLD